MQIIVGALVTVVTQYIGYAALVKKLEAKADKAELEKHIALGAAHAHHR